MFSNVVSLAVVLMVALGANAQSSTAPTAIPSGITACSLGCIQGALASGGCTSITDLQCICNSADFQNAALTCLQSSCSAEEVSAAQAAQTQECVGIATSSAASSSAASSLATATSSIASEVSSAASSITSAASSVVSSLSSARSSVASSLSSRVSSLSSSISSAVSSATHASSTATSTSSGAAPAQLGYAGLIGTGVALFGAVVGAGLVL